MTGATGRRVRPRASAQSSQGQTRSFFPLSVTMSVEWSSGSGEGRAELWSERGCAMTARASGEGRRTDCRVGCAQGGQGSGAEEGCFSWKGMAGDWRIWHFQSVTNRLRSRKRAGSARSSAEWHAWTEPDHACPDERRDGRTWINNKDRLKHTQVNEKRFTLELM